MICAHYYLAAYYFLEIVVYELIAVAPLCCLLCCWKYNRTSLDHIIPSD